MKFTGHERDLGDLGGVTPGDDDLDYMHARYYSPLFGRFLSTDPIVASDPLLPQSWNQYSYAYANPVNFIDLFGLFECGGGSCEDEITVIAEAGDELLGVDALLDHINQSLIPDFGIDLGEQTLGEFLSSVNEAGGTRACVSYDCRMLQIVGSADEDPLLKAIEGGAALNTSLLLGAMKIPAVRPIPATGRLGQAFVRSSLARRLFGKSRYLNTGRHLRIGFGRGEQGGRLVFRIGGDFLRKLGVRSGKIDLIDFGQIPRF